MVEQLVKNVYKRTGYQKMILSVNGVWCVSYIDYWNSKSQIFEFDYREMCDVWIFYRSIRRNGKTKKITFNKKLLH